MSYSMEHAVTVLISRRVKVGCEANFERLCTNIMAVAATFPGYLGSQLVHPGEETEVDDALYHVVLAFSSQASLDIWKNSPARSLGLEALEAYIEGPPVLRNVSGLAFWFKGSGGVNSPSPPRWKIAVITWIGVFPTVYILFLMLGDLLNFWPLVLRTMLLTILVVAIMTWVVAPLLTRILKPWIYSSINSKLIK